MVTTETTLDRRRAGVTIVTRAALAALLVGLLVTGLGLLVGGGQAGLAGLIGMVVVVVVLFSGTLVVTMVAELMPAASLMVALLTYVLQTALLGLLLLPLSVSDWGDEHLDAPWLAASVIGGALVWTVCQVLLYTRARIPVYDLPQRGESVAAGAAQPEGGER